MDEIMTEMSEQEKDSMSTPKCNKTNEAINGLRGLVALIIALFHFELIFPFGRKNVFSTGYLGVEFFFILSGFLLVRSYYSQSNSGEYSIRKVMIKKITRFYPPYFVAVVSLILLYSINWFGGNVYKWIVSEEYIAKSMLAELCMVQTSGIGEFRYIDGPVWYVSALIICTFIYLLFLKLTNKYTHRIVIPVVTVLSYIALYKLNMYMSPETFICGSIPTAWIRGIAGMGLGMTAYFIYIMLGVGVGKLRFITSSILEVITVSCFFAMLLFRTPSKWNYLVLVPSSILIILLFSNRGIVSKVLEMKVFQFFGAISFSFYLMQSTCSNFVHSHLSFLKQPLVTIVYLVINIVSGAVVYYFVEKQGSKYLKYKKISTICKITTSMIISLLFIIVLGQSKHPVKEVSNEISLTISAKNSKNDMSAGKEITLVGITVEGEIIEPNTIFSGNWIHNEKTLTWRDYDQPDDLEDKIYAVIPYTTDITLQFVANKWSGIAYVNINGKDIEVDCYKDADNDIVTVELNQYLKDK